MTEKWNILRLASESPEQYAINPTSAKDPPKCNADENTGIRLHNFSFKTFLSKVAKPEVSSDFVLMWDNVSPVFWFSCRMALFK